MLYRRVVFLALALIVAGCSAAAQREAFLASTYQVTTRHAMPISVEVAGGDTADIFESMNVSNETFGAAVEEAIKRSGVFSAVVPRGGAPLILQVSLQRLTRPTAASTTEAQLGAIWTVKRGADVLWRDIIVTKGSATPGDTLLGVKRGAMAIQRATQNNITRGIQQLSEAEFK